jgi:hypothetical protein
MSKFNVGNKIKLINDSGLAAKVGALAKVTGISNGYVYVKWDKKTSNGQCDGGYFPSNFELVPISNLNKKEQNSMLNKNALKWIEALRSGKFKQGKNALRAGDSFCCLGVACELYRKTRKKGFIKWDDQNNFHTLSDKRHTFLPKSVQAWLGLTSNWGELNHDGSLAILNDEGKTFNEIADIIEQNVDKLFVKKD